MTRTSIATKDLMLIADLIEKIIPAYDKNGNTVDEYYNNIILPDITPEQIQMLKKFSVYDF